MKEVVVGQEERTSGMFHGENEAWHVRSMWPPSLPPLSPAPDNYSLIITIYSICKTEQPLTGVLISYSHKSSYVHGVTHKRT